MRRENNIHYKITPDLIHINAPANYISRIYAIANEHNCEFRGTTELSLLITFKSIQISNNAAAHEFSLALQRAFPTEREVIELVRNTSGQPIYRATMN